MELMTTNKLNLYIITGTSRGLGKAFYEYCSQFTSNHFILINKSKVKVSGKNVKNLAIDLSKKLTIKQLSSVLNFKNIYKNIYLINNASIITPIKPIGKAVSNQLVASINVNFLNHVFLTNSFIKKVSEFKGNKKILNITSGAAISPHYGLAAYCSTKAALEMFARSVFKEQQKLKQVDILNLRPGIINTSMQKTLRTSAKDDFANKTLYQKIYQQKKLLEPKCVAEKIYQVLNNNAYWRQDILDINEL